MRFLVDVCVASECVVSYRILTRFRAYVGRYQYEPPQLLPHGIPYSFLEHHDLMVPQKPQAAILRAG